MTQKEWSDKYYENTDAYKKWAEGISRYIVVRDYNDGNSSDIPRRTTKDEEKMIYEILDAAMWTYARQDRDLASVLDMAEVLAVKLIKLEEGEINGYDTIYIPLQEIMGKWNRE